MRKQLGILTIILALFIIAGCPTIESKGSVTEIKISLNGENATLGVTIEEGQSVTLTADVGVEPKYVYIVWENYSDESDDSRDMVDIVSESHVEIVSSGEGPDCQIRGKSIGDSIIVVKAWRSGEKPVEIQVPVTVKAAVVTGIGVSGDSRIGVGEQRVLNAEISPSWAANYPVEWTLSSGGAYANLSQAADGTWILEGVSDGSVTLDVTSGNYTANISFTIITPQTLSSLEIYLDGVKISGESVVIGVYEEKFLSAQIEPAGAFTVLYWSSSGEDVEVDSSGVIKGINAQGSAIVTVQASNLSASITVNVANPVSGVRIKYDNVDELSVSNVVWLFQDDYVELKADLMPDGISGNVYWSGGEGMIRLEPSADGLSCRVTGLVPDVFEAAAIIVRVSARNSDNGNRDASAVFQVKVLQDEPIWAWDRARDADANVALKEFGTGYASDWPAGASVADVNGLPGYQAATAAAATTTYNDQWELKGRGTLADVMEHTIKRVKVPYTEKGLDLNSTTGSPSYDANSTILVIGSKDNRDTRAYSANLPNNGFDVPGVFDFTKQLDFVGGEYVERDISKQIRVSVDFEVVSSNGRQLGIHINNSTSTNANSPLGTSNRLAYRAINEAKGTKITYSTYLDSAALIERQEQGWESLANATVNFVLYSGGANILISGIRIEYGE